MTVTLLIRMERHTEVHGVREQGGSGREDVEGGKEGDVSPHRGRGESKTCGSRLVGEKKLSLLEDDGLLTRSEREAGGNICLNRKHRHHTAYGIGNGI